MHVRMRYRGGACFGVLVPETDDPKNMVALVT